MSDHSGAIFLFDGEFTKDGLDAVFSTLKDPSNIEEVKCMNVRDNKLLYELGKNDPFRLDGIKHALIDGKVSEVECNIFGDPRTLSGENFFHIERLSDDLFQVKVEGDNDDMKKTFNIRDTRKGAEVLYRGKGNFKFLTKK